MDDDDGIFVVVSRKIFERFIFLSMPRSLQAIDGVMSLALSPQAVSRHAASLKVLNLSSRSFNLPIMLCRKHAWAGFFVLLRQG